MLVQTTTNSLLCLLCAQNRQGSGTEERAAKVQWVSLLLLSFPKGVHLSVLLTFHTEIGFPSSLGSQRGALTAYEESGCWRQLATDLLSSTQRASGKERRVQQDLSRSVGAIAELWGGFDAILATILKGPNYHLNAFLLGFNISDTKR